MNFLIDVFIILNSCIGFMYLFYLNCFIIFEFMYLIHIFIIFEFMYLLFLNTCTYYF